MIRKLSSLLIMLIVLSVGTLLAVAENSGGLKIYNADFTTSNLNSTFIEGEVSIADGQDIELDQGLKNIARISLPRTGKEYSFRIKVPAASINKDGETEYRVKALSTEKVPKSLPVKVKVAYKPKKVQTISVEKDSFKMTVPGERKKLKASASSGDKIKYVSDNTKVVQIDRDGNLVPIGAGNATVSLLVAGDNKYEPASKNINVTIEQTDGYLVRYHSSVDGQKDEIKEQLFETDVATALEPNTFENGDHEFFGWADEDGGLVRHMDEESVTNLADNGKSTDLYAVWAGDGANAAVAWALKIANDDSFTYGARPATAAPGCYFCGTSSRTKPRGYEKTYVCMTFVHAAYAHGAEDPEMLRDCQAGRYTLSLHDWNFSHWSCWEKIGRCSQLTVNDLEPGDVIIWWADNDYSGHASLYAGDGDIVDAGEVGWGSNSIAVRKGQAGKYLSRGASHNSKSYVMRYVKPEE